MGRAPGNVWDVEHTADGRIRRIKRKEPPTWVNHYAFHIMDREWGHVIIRVCPHPPFNALVILNGHEWVALEAEQEGLKFTKEDNCFTEMADARGLGLVADTLSSSESSGGRVVQVSERWIYSAVLCFAMDIADQERTGFRYNYSVFQAEYSRNLLFRDGRQMDQVFSGLIDRVRGPLDIRLEAMAHNIRDLRCRLGGLDMNRSRIRAIMEAILALSPNPRGFTSSELAARVRRLLADEAYSPGRAAYDLRKLRCKSLVQKIPRSRRYAVDASGLRAMAALLILRDRVLRPLMAAASRREPAPQPRTTTVLDLQYAAVHNEMRKLFTHLGIAA